MFEEVNGLPIAEIERRSRRLVDRTEDPQTWRYRSSSGFLGENERFLDVVASDRQLTALLGTSDTELADRLGGLVQRCHYLDAVEQRNPERTISDGGQTFTLRCVPFVSPQFSPFWNEDRPHSEENQQWSVDYWIVNHKLPGCTLWIGGDHQAGVLDWIRRYGFYEGGGGSNPYRLDPALVQTVLTGRITTYSLEAFRQRKVTEVASIDQEESELHALHAPEDYLAARGFAASRQALRSQIAEWEAIFLAQECCNYALFAATMLVTFVLFSWKST